MLPCPHAGILPVNTALPHVTHIVIITYCCTHTCTQATLQQLQGDLDALKAQHAHTEAELAGAQEGSAALQGSNQELKTRVEGLEQQVAQVWGGSCWLLLPPLLLQW